MGNVNSHDDDRHFVSDFATYCLVVASGEMERCGKHEEHLFVQGLYNMPGYREHAFDCTTTSVKFFDQMRMEFDRLIEGEPE